MDTFSPNTSAFFSYLSSMPTEQNPTSLPPSAFFSMPVPGRDTPEDTPPSSKEVSRSPDKAVGRGDSLSEQSEGDSAGRENSGRRQTGAGAQKRKAGHGVTRDEEEDDEEDESGSDSQGHEDKRQHGKNQKNPSAAINSRRGGRKSNINEEGQKGSKEVGKVTRRKEQNRAAQKAFRERREAKVRDLEEKIAELESKSYGASIENENLRGILKRLQEENVALKQSAFTFAMPVSGTVPDGDNINNSLESALPDRGAQKPPAAPESTSGEALRSVDEVAAQTHRDSTGSGSTSDSLVLLGGGENQAQQRLFGAETFNPFASGSRPAVTGTSKADARIDASKPSSGVPAPFASPANESEIDALWASFYPDGLDSAPAKEQRQNPDQAVQPVDQAAKQPEFNALSPFALLGSQPFATSFASGSMFDDMAYRDPGVAPAAPPAVPAVQAQDVWADFYNDDFLASLTGDNNDKAEPGGVEEDDLNAQLQQYLQQPGPGDSPSAAFTLPSSAAFSPTNYLDMSPSPLNPVPQAHSPQSQETSESSPSSEDYNSVNDASRGDPYGSGVSTRGPAKTQSELVYIIDENGKVVPPPDLFGHFGRTTDAEHLKIDDLCDMMRAKATCKDGTNYVTMKDAEYAFRYHHLMGGESGDPPCQVLAEKLAAGQTG